MRFRQFKTKLFEELRTSISAENLEGMKDLISRRIKDLPDDEATAKALKEIEDLLQHLGKGGRSGAIGQEILSVEDDAVTDAKKVLSRLVLSLAEEVSATPEQRAEFFELWRTDKIVNVETILAVENRGMSVKFADIFNGYAENPLIREFVNEVMEVPELGMGRGEFGLNVLSKSITTSKASKKDDEEEGGEGAKKGDLQITADGRTYQVELKTELGGAARFGDQEVRPAEGFEAAAIALNNYVKKHKIYKNIGWQLSGSGLNLKQAIEFYQSLPATDRKTYLGLVRQCLSLIFGNIKGGRKEHLIRLRKNVNEIMDAVETGQAGVAQQAYSQASFNFYMSRKHDDGVLYVNLNSKTCVYYDDAAQLLAAGLRFHNKSAPYISATKDPVRSVYPQISVMATTRGGAEAQKGLKKFAKRKNPLSDPEFATKLQNWTTSLAVARGVTNKNVQHRISMRVVALFGQGTPVEEIIPILEKEFPALAVNVKTQPKIVRRTGQPAPPPAPAVQKPPVAAPTTAPTATPTTMQQPQKAV